MEPHDETSGHWERIYSQRSANERSWTEDVPVASLSLVDLIQLPTDAAIIDIGGGASTFADELLNRGYTDLTVLDIAQVALNELRLRVETANPPPTIRPTLLTANILDWQPQRTFALWHDRAVFHFLVNDDERIAYRDRLGESTALGSHVILATFAPTGPESCSGLSVRRYSTSELVDFFSPIASVISTSAHEHITPNGAKQPFSWVVLRR